MTSKVGQCDRDNNHIHGHSKSIQAVRVNNQLMTPKPTPVENESAMVLGVTPEENDIQIMDTPFNHPDDHCVCTMITTQPSFPLY